MPKDHINVNVAHLSLNLDMENAEAVHPVGLSHLKDYLTIMFGEEVPHEPRDKNLASNLLGSLALLSTDERLVGASELDPLARIPYWLMRMTPVVNNTKALGKRVDERFIELEGTKNGLEKFFSNDLTYLAGLFDLTSFVVATQMEIEHPRGQVSALMDRSKAVVPLGDTFLPLEQPNPTAFELLIELPLIKVEYRQRMAQLRHQGKKIVNAAEANVECLRLITKKLEL